MKKKISILISVPAILISLTTYSDTTYTKQWTVGTITGAFSPESNVRYYIEPQLRLINDPYVFNQAFLLTGLGYQINPAVVFYSGIGDVYSKNPNGETSNEYRLWQQLNWDSLKKWPVLFNNRLRFEEKDRDNESDIRVDCRERLWIRIPIKNTSRLYYSTFDELFFNLNTPSWGNNRFFYQNRVFFGIGKKISTSTMIDFGYLNQLQLAQTNEMSNVILLSAIVTLV